MYAQLGNVRFEFLRGFTGLRRDREATFAEMPLLDGKARLQRIGSALQAIGLDMLLRREFTDPVADVNELDELREAGEVLPFLTGDGTFMGNFVITRLSETVNETDTEGIPVSVTLAVDLREFIDPNPEATEQEAARKNGFATNPAKVVPVRLERLGTTPMAVTSTSVKESATASVSAIGDVKKAEADASQSASLLARAGQKLKQAQDAAQTAIQQIQDFASLATIAPTLLATVQGLAENAALLKAYVDAGDLTNALTQSDALAGAVGNVDGAIQPLNSHLIRRGPQ